MDTNSIEYFFTHPHWLWFLLTIPLLILLRGIKKKPQNALLHPLVHRLSTLSSKQGTKSTNWADILLYLSITLAIIALARPRAGSSHTEITHSGVDIYLVLDVSQSMLAEDFFSGSKRINRITVVRKVSKDFIQKRPHDRIGIVAFSTHPVIISPTTLDHTALTEQLEQVKVGIAGKQTGISTAIAIASQRLEKSKAKSKVIILLTDGEDTASTIDPITAARAAATLGAKIYTIGVGTHGIVPMPVQTFGGRKTYRNVNTSFDEQPLIEIAELSGAIYQRATDTQELKKIFDQIDKMEKTKMSENIRKSYTELFTYFLLPSLLLLTLWYSIQFIYLKTLP